MQASSLPQRLTEPIVVDGRVVCKLMQDLTVYLVGPTPNMLDVLIDIYESIAPPGSLVKYKIEEHELWFALDRPELTASGRDAAAHGARRAWCEPSRRRIVEGRGFEAGLWDGREIDDMLGSWSFMCRRVQWRDSGSHAFARLLTPLTADIGSLRDAALAIAEHVPLYSGHGGLVFVYDPWNKELALDYVYALARRYWGIDIEDLNRTIELMHDAIKGVNWLTLVGQRFRQHTEIAEGLQGLKARPEIDISECAEATVVTAGSVPVAGDRHRPNGGLDAYIAIAQALRPLFPSAVHDFSSARFIEQGNTLGWIRRFVEPSGWR